MKNVLKSINKAMTRRKMYSQTVRELSALNNRELNDLGISRGEIELVARQHSLSI